MARPMQIAFAGALYHVTARGKERKPVNQPLRVTSGLMTLVGQPRSPGGATHGELAEARAPERIDGDVPRSLENGIPRCAQYSRSGLVLTSDLQKLPNRRSISAPLTGHVVPDAARATLGTVGAA